MTPRILGLIPARGGSKGILGKNIKPLAGRPLIAYTIEAAHKTRCFARLIVSTDDVRIARVARRFGAEVPFLRPFRLAQAQSTALEVVQHALAWLKEHEGEEFDAVMILQPTSPLRTAFDITAAVRLFQKTGADSVMSMVQLSDFHLSKLKKIGSNGRILHLVENEGTFSRRRQDTQPVFKRNCAIYLTKTSFLLKGDLFGKKSYAYVMPPERSIDINEPADFSLAEFWKKRAK